MASSQLTKRDASFTVRPLVRHWEEPRSFLQRAAVQRGASSTRLIANRIRFPMTFLPTDEQVAVLERSFGLAPGAIADTAVRSRGHNLATFAGEYLAPTHSLRARRRVCPQCLDADRQDDDLEPDADARPWVRSYWNLTWITCCPVHRLRLVSQCNCRGTVAGPDGPIDRCSAGHRAMLQHEPVPSTEVDAARYLLSRITDPHRPASVPLLDDMPWHEAARLALSIGLFRIHGREPPKRTGRLPIEVAGPAIGIGIDDLKRFPETFERLLDDLSAPELRLPGGPQGRYGSRFYVFMQRDRGGLLEPLRNVFERHAGLITASDGAASRLTDTRRLQEECLTRSEAARFRRALPDVVVPPSLTKRDALRLGRQAGVFVSTSEAGVVLDVGEVTINQLGEAGVLRPAWSTRGLADNWLYRDEVSALRDRLMRLSETVPSLPPGAIRFDSFAKYATKLSVVVSAIMKGVAIPLRLADAKGIRDLAFDPAAKDAIWQFCVGPRFMLLTTFKAEEMLTNGLVNNLNESGILRVASVQARRAVGVAAVKRFRRRFASGASLAHGAGLPSHRLHAILDAAGCRAVTSSTDRGRLYSIEDVWEHLAAAGIAPGGRDDRLASSSDERDG